MTTPLRALRTGTPPALMLEVEHGLVTQFRVEAARRDMPVKRSSMPSGQRRGAGQPP